MEGREQQCKDQGWVCVVRSSVHLTMCKVMRLPAQVCLSLGELSGNPAPNKHVSRFTTPRTPRGSLGRGSSATQQATGYVLPAYPGVTWRFPRSLQRRTGIMFGSNVFRVEYRGTSHIKNCHPLGPYSRSMPRALWWSQGGGGFLRARYPCSEEGGDR